MAIDYGSEGGEFGVVDEREDKKGGTWDLGRRVDKTWFCRWKWRLMSQQKGNLFLLPCCLPPRSLFSFSAGGLYIETGIVEQAEDEEERK